MSRIGKRTVTIPENVKNIRLTFKTKSSSATYPYEIKKTSNPTVSMIKNFNKLNNANKNIGNGGIICCYDKLMHIDDNNYIIPISSVINIKEENNN